MRSKIVLAALLGVAGTMIACSSSARAPQTADPVSGTAESLQLIVKFRDVSDPSDPVFLKRLAAGLGAPVAYVRPLSGGFHLVRAYPPPGTVDALLARFKSRPDVSHVEPDLPVRRQ